MPKKPTVRKQTSARVSSMAAKLLAKLPKRGTVWGWIWISESDNPAREVCSAKTLRSICLSAISQDESPGQSTIGSRRLDSLTVKPKAKGRR